MKKVFLFLTMLLFAFTGTMKAESLTVHDGTTTNGNVPVYGFYADAYNKCEMVYPAAELSEMAGGTINSLTFYASQENVEWGANFQVFVAEVADATISAFAGPGTVVYEGQLSIVDGEMVVTFDTPYTYGGGNLLVGVYQTSTGSYITSTWYGEGVNGASGSGYDYSGLDGCNFGQKNFLPKTTFDYTVGGGGGGELVEVTIGDPTSTTTNGYLPGYTLYDYSISQQIYTADEIGVAGTINTLTVWLKNTSSYARNINVYMKEVEATEFASNTAWESFAAADMVASFTMPNGNDTPIEVAFDLNNPFVYSGNSSLVICFQDVTGQWSSGLGGVEMDATGNQALYAYRDGTVYDPSNPGVNGTLLAKKNVIRLSIMTSGDEPKAFATVPAVLDLGYRPNGAWMAPYVFKMKSNVGAVTVNYLDFSGNYFTYNAELPASVTAGNPLEVAVNHGEAEAGEVNSTITILYSGNSRDAEQLNITAIAYDPAEGDVFEQAIEVPTLAAQTPYTDEFPADMYKNYELPVETEANDAVYEMTFDHDVLLYAGAEEGNVVLYNHDFNGKPGPMADNQYVYNGPQINPGPMAMWFSYDYTGTNTWYGTSAGGGMIFGYRITAEMLQELGLGACAITTVETAARNATYEFYDLMLLKGGDTPDLNNMVYYQGFEDFTPGYFFDVNLDEPQFLGDDENIWVMFYTDAPYAAYCGRYPVDANNGKIWYTIDNSTWYSSTTYTPAIYTRFLELPTGREVTVNLADMKIRESKPAEGQMLAMAGEAMGTPKAQMQKANRGNRETQTLLEQGFEDGMGEWTMNNCHSSSGPSSSYTAHGGSSVFRFYYTSNYPQYLISPVLEDNNGGNMSFYYASYSLNYDETFKVGYSTTTNDPSAFTWGSQVTATNVYSSEYLQYGYDFPAGTKYVAIACTSNDQFYFFVDDIVVTADITSGGGGGGGEPTPYVPYVPTFTAEIDGMYVPAGSYYLVAAAAEQSNVNIAINTIPAPEQAYIISPYDGETNVATPYLAEWILGDYTTEMQVLVGTQYPPQTAMIDWTDYLVESAFLTDLEPNQSYFMQVNVRNATGTTEGEIIAFTTPIDPVQGFAVAETELYPGDAAVFTWEANRSLQGYNLYMSPDGGQTTIKVNDAVITENTYSVEDLEYNMDGYLFAVTSVYDAGESDFSDILTVYMTGNGSVSGHVYDTDTEHPIAGATIMAIGVDEHGNEQTFTLTTDETGLYEGDILAGLYVIGIVTEGYANEGVAAEVTYNELTEVEDIITREFYYPLSEITATEEDNDVLVEWSWTPASLFVDFETGDFSQAEFNNTISNYPWIVTTTNPHEGTYCMKSNCEAIANGNSAIEVTVDVPYDAKMGFYVRVSSESSFDKFHFYIDGVEKGSAISGQQPYGYKEFDVLEGTHTYKWEYAKDGSVNSNDDCVYVDDITMYRKDEPLPPVVGATVYNFDDNTMMGWTSIDADGDGNGWVSSSEPGIYHNSGVNLSGTGNNASEAYVISGSYANQTTQALTPDNYLVSPTAISAQAGAQIQFWACAQDASYAAEHFGVAVSTTTATAAAFTTIQEWTMTAKDGGRGAEDHAEVRGTRQGTWYSYSVDLSSYAGQDIWVAIRHFNCTDMFILNVDDITLADGSEAVAPRGNRSLVSYNLYRRNNVGGGDAELIFEGLADTIYSYQDADWATLSYGEYQWGIAATYEGYSPLTNRNRETATFGFENGSLEGWTGIVVNTDGGEWIHSNNNLGGYDYTEVAHTGTGFAMCYSYVDYVGAYDTDAYLVSPQKYSVDANSSISFWADNANDDYPENFSVCVSTAANPTAASFTQVWSGGAKGTSNGGATVRRAENRYNNWRSHEVSLAAYAGQEIWIAFHDVNYDAYEIWIDDVTITYAGTPGPGPGPGPTPTPGPTGDGISEIIWSNTIEKDMNATLSFTLALNNGQSPAGALIEIVGENDSYTETADDSGLVDIEVRKGQNYVMTVTKDGYTSWSEEEFVEENEYEFNVLLNEIVAPVEGFYVSPTGWAMWEGEEPAPTPGPGPTPPGPQPGTGWTEGFESGMPAGWNVIDANNDGWTWCLTSAIPSTWTYYASVTLDWYRTGTNAICSGSYINGVGALTPDEYLVMGQQAINNGTTFSFWAAATDASYPADHFGVAVSDNGTDWTMVQEWTLTAKEGVVAGGRESRDGNGAKLGTWHQFTTDLSAHAGNKYLAIRHFNCTDQYIMCVDDLEFTPGSKGNRAPLSYKLILDGNYVGETTNLGYQFDVENMEAGSVHTAMVAPLYTTGMGDWMTYEWTYTPCSNFNGVTDLAAAAQGNDVKLTWTLPGTPGPGPTPPGPTTDEEYDFDDATFQGWTTIDANNDGYDWILGSQIGGVYLASGASLAGTGHNSSADLVCSGSYSNATSQAITPDNYLVSPNKGTYSQVSFYACAQDASYAAEHFGVAVATAASPTASDFTMVQEWTMTAKDAGAMSIGRDGQTRAQGSWYEKTVDLSAYAGQQIWIAIRHFNCNDQFILNVDDITLTAATKAGNDRAMWDLEYQFNGTSGYQYGVASDGEYIYTSSWSASSSSMFYKYDLQGNFIEEFNISGCGQLRGMTYDGEYFYGVANAATVYCVDLANHTLVSQFTTSYGAMRCITYDPERDGFWVVGHWSGNLTLIDRTGAIVETASAPTSASDVAYYKDDENVEHILYIKNESGNGEVYEYNITTGTMGSSPLFNCLNTTGATIAWTGSSGGCFVGAYNGKTCFFADAQQSPQLINIYELSASAPGPGPGPGPQPGTEGILGVMVFADGEYLAYVEGNNVSQYVVEGAAEDAAEYGVRVVYDGEIDVTYYAMSCMETVDYTPGTVTCDPVTNLVAYYAEHPTYGPGANIEWDGNENAVNYTIYVNGESLGNTTDEGVFLYGLTVGATYTFGIVANYATCSSEMVTVEYTHTTAVEETEIVNAIYPNPTSGDLHINATAMTRVSVYNAMGQMVYNQDVKGDEMVIDMAQFEAGVYMVRIDTESGSSVKRITVVK